ncbi:MAG: rhodanese-like domain-containing protein [Desulfuromonadaceae bacterium]|nr:rhodanese-like domain-containing protein [Desulfuromonadaceae bacterium]
MYLFLKQAISPFFRLLLSALLVLLACLPAVAAETTYHSITTDQLKNMMDTTTSMAIIDARTPEEYTVAHLHNAINVPEKGIEKAVAQLPVDKNALLVLYCNGIKCGKSKRVAAKLELMGYSNFVIYSEGIPVWEERDLPLVKGPGYGKKIETSKLKPAELAALIKSAKGDYVLVDVRDDMEFAEGHIPSAVNMPTEKLAALSEKLPKEKKIIVYCNTGSRSYLGYKKLVGLAYPHIYQTLFAEWKEAGLPVEK